MTQATLARALRFARDYGLRVPILMAPMAGACPPALAAAVADAGGMGACGALLLDESGIADWSARFRARSNGAFQLNTWIPDPAPARNPDNEALMRRFLADWGPEVPPLATVETGPNFLTQCDAMLASGPSVVSSIMGLYPPSVVATMKARGIRWFATVTTVAEARTAVAAGADAIVAQGAEAGGHRGAFAQEKAETQTIGLFSLLPAVVDAVDVPVIATGGIGDGRGVAAALTLGASAVQVGTALLRSPEAGLPSAWTDAIANAAPEDTEPTRAFSGRLGRAVTNDYLRALRDPLAPSPAPFPVQRALTGPMRARATESNDLAGMQAWAGQSAGMAADAPAGEIVEALWSNAVHLLTE